MQAYATRVPPADYPFAASKLGCVIFFEIRYSAQLIKSSMEFGLLCNFPWSCHWIPFSPPPLTKASAMTQPLSIALVFAILNPYYKLSP